MTESPLLIIGQGLAGSLLGWECERAGVPFRIVDRGHGAAASRVGAGLVSPLTGRRLVPSWRIAEWREAALAAYRELGRELGRPIVTTLRIRRWYRDAAERRRWQPRLADPAVAAWIEGSDDEGLWIRGGFRVDTAALITGLRHRWTERGWLAEHELAPPALQHGPQPQRLAGHETGTERVVWCVGAAEAPGFEFVPWERALGQLLVGEAPAGSEPDVLAHDGQWVLVDPDRRLVRVGATYERAATVAAPTSAACAELKAAARRLTGREIVVIRQEAAQRVGVPDRRPVLGWHPARPGWGIFSGLGSKGTLWAPPLARQWLELLREGGEPADPVAVSRFWR